MFKKISLSFLLFFNLACLHAQTHEIGVGMGIANYRGDMSYIVNIKQPGLHTTFFYRYNPNEIWSFRANASAGQIKCADSKSQDNVAKARGHEFLTNVIEFSGQIEYNFLNFGQGTARNPHRFSPYALLGFGFVKLDPLRNTTPNYNTWARSVPMGGGIKWLIKRNIQLSAEIGARFTSTDYLDDLGLNTGSPTTPTNPKLTGNPNTRDMYFFSHISLSYIFRNKKDICPQF